MKLRLVYFVFAIIVVFVLLYIIRANPIFCKNKDALGEVLRVNLAESVIKEAALNRDFVSVSTSIVLHVSQSNLQKDVIGYNPRAWLPIDNCPEPFIKSDLSILSDYGISDNDIIDYGTSFSEAKIAIFGRPYEIRYYQIGNADDIPRIYDYFIITDIPRLVFVVNELRTE